MSSECRSAIGSRQEAVLGGLAAATALFYLYTMQAGQVQPAIQRGILLGVCMLLTFLYRPVSSRAPRWTRHADLLLAGLSVAAIVIIIRSEREAMVTGFYTLDKFDMYVGIVLALLLMEACRRSLGMVFPIIAGTFLVYAYTSHLWPGPLHTAKFDPLIVTEFIATSTEGIFGAILHVVSTMVIAFLIFGAFVKWGGAGVLFTNLPMALLSRFRGGPAKVAVVGSGLFGMISGSSTANVAMTGTFTIPMMKGIGYSAGEAGAVEACASTGGMIMPPVMGAAAFLIAENLGISYWQVCVAAFIPAAIYYVALYVTVDVKAVKHGLKGTPSQVSVGKVLKTYGYLVVPLGILIYILAVVEGSPMTASFWAIVAVVVLGWIRPETRMGPKKIYGALREGIQGSTDVVLVVAACGILVATFALTALAFKLTVFMTIISAGNALVLVLLAGVLCYILGMGITATAIYVLVSLLVAPPLVKAGLPALAVHLAVFYFGILSNITPPVAPAVFVAAAVAKDTFWRVGKHSVRLGLVLFILPLVFIFEPSLIMQGAAAAIALTVTTTLIGVILLIFSLEGGSFWGRVSRLPRLLFGLASAFLFIPGIRTDLIGLAILTAAALWHWQELRRYKVSLAAEAAGGSGGQQ